MTDFPIHSADQNVPVFDCHVAVRGPNENRQWSGIVLNLPEVECTAGSERDLLRKISQQFKARMISARESGETINWQEKRPLEPGEQQRWIPVHL